MKKEMKFGRKTQKVHPGGLPITVDPGILFHRRKWLTSCPMITDERILGESDFVRAVLAEANEKYDHRYKLKRLGYDLKKIQEIVTGLYQIDGEDLYSRSRQKTLAEARSLFCYWAVRELGMNGTDLAKRLRMTQPGVVYAVRRGERLAKEKNHQLVH